MQTPSPEQLATLTQRRIASVATINADGTPHLTSVWFLYEQGCLYLAIPSSSVKARNLAARPEIAVMVDVRQSAKESGVTAIGQAELVTGEACAGLARRLHEKYLTPEALADPAVGPVFGVIDDVVVKLVPSRWISWDMAALDAQAFDGAIARNAYVRELEP